MIFKMEHNPKLIAFYRRKWRKDGRFTVRVTCTGTISVIRMPLHKDMKTEEQLKCRARFVQAQQMMLEALKDKKRMRYFQRKQRSYGYKTLRGCMMAHFIEFIIQEEKRTYLEALGSKMKDLLSPVTIYDDNAILLSKNQRFKLSHSNKHIFPEDWDLSTTETTSQNEKYNRNADDG